MLAGPGPGRSAPIVLDPIRQDRRLHHDLQQLYKIDEIYGVHEPLSCQNLLMYMPGICNLFFTPNQGGMLSVLESDPPGCLARLQHSVEA